MIELGDKYADDVTGFVGVATARTEYLKKSPVVMLEAQCGMGDAQERWFPEDRLVVPPSANAGFAS